MLIITAISIFGLTFLFWLMGKAVPFRICSVCAGVSTTWFWMLAGRLIGYDVDLQIISILMGGSAVGIAYQLEKRLPPGRSILFWKTVFIVVGFAAAYGLVSFKWLGFAAAAGLLAVMAFLLARSKRHSGKRGVNVEELKKEMNNCC